MRRTVVDPRFPARLRELRHERGMSLRQLARAVPCSHAYVHDLERGHAHPSPEMAARLDSVLNAGGQLMGTLREVDRRQFLAAAALPAVAALDAGATTSSLAGLRTALDGLREIEDSAGPEVAAGPATALAETAELLARSARSALRADAVAWVAELYTYVGHMRTLSQEWTVARRSLDRAVAAAVESGQPLPLAHALGKASILAYECEDLARADALAVACLRADGGPHPAASYTYTRAEIAAREGRQADARRLLGEAERAAGAVDGLAETMPWSTPTFYAAASAMVLHELGDPAAAGLMAAAWEEFPARWRRARWAARYRAVAVS